MTKKIDEGLCPVKEIELLYGPEITFPQNQINPPLKKSKVDSGIYQDIVTKGKRSLCNEIQFIGHN